MTQTEVIELLEKKYNAVVVGHNINIAVIKLTIDGHRLDLPAPMRDEHYTEKELNHIVDVWNGKTDGAVRVRFNAGDLH